MLSQSCPCYSRDPCPICHTSLPCTCYWSKKIWKAGDVQCQSLDMKSINTCGVALSSSFLIPAIQSQEGEVYLYLIQTMGMCKLSWVTGHSNPGEWWDPGYGMGMEVLSGHWGWLWLKGKKVWLFFLWEGVDGGERATVANFSLLTILIHQHHMALSPPHLSSSPSLWDLPSPPYFFHLWITGDPIVSASPPLKFVDCLMLFSL